jgi:hypothetical protein
VKNDIIVLAEGTALGWLISNAGFRETMFRLLLYVVARFIARFRFLFLSPPLSLPPVLSNYLPWCGFNRGFQNILS